MGRYLVTGGAGFIGSRMAERLIGRGDSVLVMDDLTSGYRRAVPEGAEFLDASIAHPGSYDRLDPKGIDAVMHFGGQSSGEVSHEDPILDFDVNARGTLLLLRWCEIHGIKRVLYPSSQTVYGPSIGPLAEDAPKNFHSFYGASKSAAEGYLNLFGRRGGAPTVFRLFNVYGPGQNLANLKQGMVSIYLAFLLKGEPIFVKGSLERFRDFVYVDDVVDAWLKALEAPASSGRTYNIGSGRRTSVRELLDGLTGAYGCAPGTYPIVQTEGTPGDIAGNFADISRAWRDLGWEPRVNLPEGLRRMVAWAQGVGRASAAASGERE